MSHDSGTTTISGSRHRGQLGVITVVLLLILAILVAAVGAAGFALFGTWSGRQLIALINAGGIANVRLAMRADGEPVVLTSRGVVIRGSLYRPRTATPLPGIVLVHGQTPGGRRLPLYVLLAGALADRCYAVLALDLPGFGESDAPPRPEEPASWDARLDIIEAVEYLRALPSINPEQISVLGHSMGANLAVGSAALDERISKVVAIGPPHPAAEEWTLDGAPRQAHFYDAFSRTRGFEQPLPLETFMAWISLLEMETYLNHYSGQTHQPLLLIDGMRETRVRQEATARLSGLISEPKRHVIIPKADHYQNTVGFGAMMFFDQTTLRTLVDEIDQWVRVEEEGRC